MENSNSILIENTDKALMTLNLINDSIRAIDD